MSAGDDEFKVAAPSFFIVGTKGGSAQTVGIETAKFFDTTRMNRCISRPILVGESQEINPTRLAAK